MPKTPVSRIFSNAARRGLPAAAAAAALLALLSAPAGAQDAPTPNPPPPVVGDAARGQTLYRESCVDCHGPNGEGKREKTAPALHQQSDWYILAQLTKFHGGIREPEPSDTAGVRMQGIVKGLAEQDLSDLALYITSLEAGPPDFGTAGDLAAGKVQFQVCVACHGADGKGLPHLRSPSLIGQHDWYVFKQLRQFQSGVRGVHPQDVEGAQMRPMALTLVTDKMMTDVVAYIGTLQGVDVAHGTE